MDARFETIPAAKIKPGMVICGVNRIVWGSTADNHYEVLSIQKGDYASTIKVDVKNIRSTVIYKNMIYDAYCNFIILKDPLDTTHKQQAVLNKIRYLNERYEKLRSAEGTMSRMP